MCTDSNHKLALCKSLTCLLTYLLTYWLWLVRAGPAFLPASLSEVCCDRSLSRYDLRISVACCCRSGRPRHDHPPSQPASHPACEECRPTDHANRSKSCADTTSNSGGGGGGVSIRPSPSLPLLIGRAGRPRPSVRRPIYTLVYKRGRSDATTSSSLVICVMAAT